jgi:hypothetical protein
MLANRMTGFFAVDKSLDVSPVSNQFAGLRTQSPVMAGTTDIYQAAHAQAVRDYELNRLFNAEYYESDADDYQI